jgi:hypothetical protein
MTSGAIYGVVEATAVRFLSSLGSHFVFTQRVRILLRQCF